MGGFRVELDAVGGHGCQREKKDGEVVLGCGYMNCPDCFVVAFFEEFARKFSDAKGVLIHWPGTPSEVRDELVPAKINCFMNTKYEYDAEKKVSVDTGEKIPVGFLHPAHRIRHGNF